MIHYDLPDALDVLQQRMGRVDRVGQSASTVTVIVDDVMDDQDLLTRLGMSETRLQH